MFSSIAGRARSELQVSAPQPRNRAGPVKEAVAQFITLFRLPDPERECVPLTQARPPLVSRQSFTHTGPACDEAVETALRLLSVCPTMRRSSARSPDDDRRIKWCERPCSTEDFF